MGLIGKEKVRLRKFPRWDFPINLLTTKQMGGFFHSRCGTNLEKMYRKMFCGMYLCRTSIASYIDIHIIIFCLNVFFLIFLIQDFLYRLVKSDRRHDL